MLKRLHSLSIMNLILTWLIFVVYFSSSSADCLEGFSNGSSDTFLQDLASSALVRYRPQTEAVYKASLPANLSGMEVSIAHIRSRTLWKKGAGMSNFHIPSGTITVPYVRMLAIVYQNLGNQSFHHYKLSGYSLITSVVGFMVFDASNAKARSLRGINLDTMGKPISIRFTNLKFPDRKNSTEARCVVFNINGTIHFSDMILPNVCYSSDQGHFSVVVRVQKKQRPCYPWTWVVGVVLGSAGLVLMGYFGTVFVRILKTKKIQAMERQADEGVFFDSRGIGSSKMPSATVTRTQPALENGGFP